MNHEELHQLAAFRHDLRQFHFFSEQACAEQGLTTQQYQALLTLRAEHGGLPITVSMLAQQLLVKHNTAVGLIDRMEALGLAARRHSETDRRSVVLEITPRGKRLVQRLAEAHRRELGRVAPDFMRHFRSFAKTPPQPA